MASANAQKNTQPAQSASVRELRSTLDEAITLASDIPSRYCTSPIEPVVGPGVPVKPPDVAMVEKNPVI